ncbi:MAG: hypothetical protein HFACDABA_03117 [Anaerolineales bacterium]|nr:hypothetical protein [Anaerolineales bacterium]
MLHRLPPILIILLFLIACAAPANTPLPNSPEAGAPVAEPTRAPSAPPASPVPTRAPRTASFAEINNTVETRNSQSELFAPASLGQILPVGGEIRTGENSRARLDLLPDGTIVRLAPNSAFVLAALEENASGPSSKIQLAFGKIWILLNGGSLEVETPSGVASVRGSLLSVAFDPQAKRVTVTCREGHCALEDDDESLDLTEGQAADSVDGDISDEAREMTEEEQQEWEEEAPESEEFFEEEGEVTEEATEVSTEIVTEAPTEELTEEPTEEYTEEDPTEPPDEEPPPDEFIFRQ